MLNKKEAYQIIDTILDLAKGYDTRVLVQGQAEGLTRYANSEIHQNVFEDLTTVTITIIDGNKRSEQTTTDYSDQGLEIIVAEAIDNLQFLPEGSAQPPAVTAPLTLESDYFNEALATNYNTLARANYIRQGLDSIANDYLAYGTLTYTEAQFAFGNSQAVKRFTHNNMVSFTVLISSQKGGSSFYATCSQNSEDIDVVASFKQVATKAQLNQNPKQLEPGAYTVILEPAAVSDILTYLSFIGFSAKSVQNQISFLSNQIGKQVFDSRISITDDWTNTHTIPVPFDFEGYPRKTVTIIEDGVAKGLIYDTLTAMKDDVKTTGHSLNMPAQGGLPLNLVMQGGAQSLEDIIANTTEGILITRFHYMNVVNPRQAILTALTRDGVFCIKDGRITNAVKNMRFTENIAEAFNHVLAISNDRRRTTSFFGNFYVPAVKLSNFHFTGKTNA